MTDPDLRDIALPRVLPLDCNELRLIASWAANFSSNLHVFHYDASDQDTDGADRLTLAPGDAAASPETVVIPARTRARPSTLATITFALTGEGGTVAGLTLDARIYNAALWSESAVEKFLVPYVALLGGSRLAERLDPVLSVWNGYPEQLPVFALLQRNRPAPGRSLAFAELFDVLYLDVEDQEVKVLPMADFLPLCGKPMPVAASTKTLEFRRGEVSPQAPALPSERGLRRMAEYASHFRIDPLYVLFDANTGFYDRYFELPVDLAEHVVVPVFTHGTRDHRPQPISVVLSDGFGSERAFGPLQADAAFWGNGSVEHMLCPYYVSTYGRAALEELKHITDAWWGDRVAFVDPSAEVFALVHLPNSDWDPEGAEGPVLRDLEILHHARGALLPAPLSARARAAAE